MSLPIYYILLNPFCQPFSTTSEMKISDAEIMNIKMRLNSQDNEVNKDGNSFSQMENVLFSEYAQNPDKSL